MSVENFIPEVVSAELETAYQAAQIVIPTLNSDHEGEAVKGNVVKIVGAVTPTITDYAAAGRIVTAEALDSTAVDLLIDQEKAFSFNVDDVDAAQAAGSLDPYTTAAAGALAEDAEAYAVAKLIAEGTLLSSAKIDTAAKAKKALGSIRTALTQAKVPTTDRFVACNPAFADLLLEELSDASKAGSDGELRNGMIGRLYGLTVLETPAFAEEVKPIAVGYHGKAASFVSQINKTEAIRSANSFADNVRGLNVYGSKVSRPKGVVVVASEGITVPVGG